MTNGGKTWQPKLSRWLDEWKIAGSGIVLATRERKFVCAVILAFVIFGTLMNLLSGSTAALGLFWQVDLGGKFKIIWDGFLGLFGVGRNFCDYFTEYSDWARRAGLAEAPS